LLRRIYWKKSRFRWS